MGRFGIVKVGGVTANRSAVRTIELLI